MNIFRGRVLVSIFLILLGVTLLVNNLNIEGVELNLRTYWPVFPLLWGLGIVMESLGRERGGDMRSYFSSGQFLTGLVVIFISGAYLGRNLDWFQVDFSLFWRLFWPAIIILIGISLFRGRPFPRSSEKANWAVMGEVNKGRMEWDLKNESYMAFMGGVKLDLGRARIPAGQTVLDCTAIMGGIDIYVPGGIGVIMEGNAVLGGLDFLKEEAGGIIANKRVEVGLKDNPERVVVIRATAIMGGVTVKKV